MLQQQISDAFSENILQIQDLNTWFPVRRGILSREIGCLKAVNGVTLSIGRGETVGLVGESGCGKTTLGRTVLGLEKATSGRVLFEGRVVDIRARRDLRRLRRRAQMVFQDPFSSLNPRMTAMAVVTEGMIHHGLLEGSAADAAAVLLAEVGLDPASMQRYAHEFSGGQRQRLCVARALSLGPEFLICDEPVSALDVSVQAQVINLLLDLRERRGLSYLFISHDLSVVRLISHRIAVMYLGRIVEIGSARLVMDAPLHPYTKALISAVPVPGRRRGGRIILGGELPSPLHPPPGCPFHPRCPAVLPICEREAPADTNVEGRNVRCHLYSGVGEVRDDDPESTPPPQVGGGGRETVGCTEQTGKTP